MDRKVSLIRDKTLRLGPRSPRNVHEYEAASIACMPLHPRSSLVKRSSLVRKHPELAEECQGYYLPPIFAHCLDNIELVGGVCSGRRALYLPDNLYTLNLRELGWSKTDMVQEFVVDVKGTGIKLRNSEHVSKDDVAGFIRKHGISITEGDLQDELVFSRNEYMNFETPEGAQDVEGGDGSIEAYEYFSKLGFKLAPHICRIAYPSKVQRLARELDGKGALKLRLAQEKRLMPSFIRTTYLESNGNRNPEILRLINSDEGDLKGLINVMLEDMLTYFENLAFTTERRGSRYYWDCLANMESVFEKPKKMFCKPYAWYMAKDLVLANTGLYFVDLEGSLIDQDAPTRKELKRQHSLYLTCLLKDFFRLMALYNIALKEEGDTEKQERIENDSRDMIIERLGHSDYLSIDSTRNSIEVCMKYDSIRPEKYRIGKERLPMVTEVMA